MAFKMICPKCEGLDYHVERDNRTFGAVAQAFELVFHCRCGKQMFGELLIKEYEKQKREYEGAENTRSRSVTAKKAQRAKRDEEKADLRERLDYGKRFVEDRRKEQAQAEEASRQEQDRAWREKVEGPTGTPAAARSSAGAAASKPRATARSAEPAAEASPATAQSAEPAADAEGEECAWPGCEKPRRSNSKYCCRACSNKNARARHKTRTRSAKQGKTAAA